MLEHVEKLLTTTPGPRLPVRPLRLVQLTRLAVLTLQGMTPHSPLEKPIGELRARRLLRVRPTFRMALFGLSSVAQIVKPVRELERGRMPVQLVLNSLPV